MQAAHARCSSEWLAWERAHDAEFALKTAEVQDEIDRVPGQASPYFAPALPPSNSRSSNAISSVTRSTSRPPKRSPHSSNSASVAQ